MYQFHRCIVKLLYNSWDMKDSKWHLISSSNFSFTTTVWTFSKPSTAAVWEAERPLFSETSYYKLKTLYLKILDILVHVLHSAHSSVYSIQNWFVGVLNTQSILLAIFKRKHLAIYFLSPSVKQIQPAERSVVPA